MFRNREDARVDMTIYKSLVCSLFEVHVDTSMSHDTSLQISITKLINWELIVHK